MQHQGWHNTFSTFECACVQTRKRHADTALRALWATPTPPALLLGLAVALSHALEGTPDKPHHIVAVDSLAVVAVPCMQSSCAYLLVAVCPDCAEQYDVLLTPLVAINRPDLKVSGHICICRQVQTTQQQIARVRVLASQLGTGPQSGRRICVKLQHVQSRNALLRQHKPLWQEVLQ